MAACSLPALSPAITFSSLTVTSCVRLCELCALDRLRTMCLRSHVFKRSQEPTNDDEVVRVNTDLLVFPIRVRDKRGAAADQTYRTGSLAQGSRSCYPGLYLYPGADRVALVFALDQSGSLRDVISQQREAALALFRRFGERSQVAVIQFAEQPRWLHPLAVISAPRARRFSSRQTKSTHCNF